MADQQRESSLELPRFFKRPSMSRLLAVGPAPAAVVTGALVGLLGVGLGWLGLRGCSALRGTSSCGDPGLLVLIAIAVVMGIVGQVLLRAWHVPAAGSTSFLGVALTAVVAVLFSLGSYDGVFTVVALPVVAALTFAVARWLTASNTSPGDRPR